MSEKTKRSVHGKIARINAALSEAQELVSEAAHELRQSGLDGDMIMCDTGFQLLNTTEALSAAKSLIPIQP